MGTTLEYRPPKEDLPIGNGTEPTTDLESSDEQNEINSGHYVEMLHTIHIVQSLVSGQICEHVLADKLPQEASNSLAKILGELHRLYETVSEESDKFDEERGVL